MPSLTSPRGRTRAAGGYALALPVALLLMAFALVAALAYKAYQAERSHRLAAERTLHDYAEFATWEYAVRAQRSVLTAMATMFARTMTRINADHPSDSLPTVEQFAWVARNAGQWCECLGGVRFFFRYDWREHEFVTASATPADSAGEGRSSMALAPVGDDDAGLVSWALDTVVAHPGTFPKPAGMAPLAYGGTSAGGPLRRLSVLITNDSYVVLFDRRGGADYAVVYVLSRDLENEPLVTYGFVTEAAPFVQPVFGAAFKREELLPPSLLRGIPPDSVVLDIDVSDIRGRPLYRSNDRATTRYAAFDTLDATFGHVVVGAALRPELAGRLVVGGLPQSQLPLLASLVLLTAALLVGALLQLRKQQELARLRTDFVSGVSHELRTPLTQIRLFAELLRNRALRSEEERAHALRVVDQEARRLTYLVENVLDFARGERRLNRIARSPIDVGDAVRDTLEFIAPVAAARRVRLAAEVAPRTHAAVDPAAVRQILLNLLDNAVKYGPAGQTVRVHASCDGRVLRLMVDDEGTGIPEDERERIWEPYHRMQRDMDSAVGGSGIGLAVVRELAELHGGRAWAEAAPPTTGASAGARFVVELDTEDTAPPDTDSAAAAAAAAYAASLVTTAEHRIEPTQGASR